MTTTDPFTEAARVEALRAWVKESDRMDSIGTLGAHMAEWSRTHLAAQDPTDAEHAARLAHDRAYKADIAWEDEKRRADKAEARIKAVRDVLELHGPAHDEPGQDEADCGPMIIADIRRALDN